MLSSRCDNEDDDEEAPPTHNGALNFDNLTTTPIISSVYTGISSSCGFLLVHHGFVVRKHVVVIVVVFASEIAVEVQHVLTCHSCSGSDRCGRVESARTVTISTTVTHLLVLGEQMLLLELELGTVRVELAAAAVVVRCTEALLI